MIRFPAALAVILVSLVFIPIWSQRLPDPPRDSTPAPEADIPVQAPSGNLPHKSGFTAFGFSMAATILPLLPLTLSSGTGQELVALGFAGLIAGPSAGQFYAGTPLGGLAGMSIRGLGTYLALSGISDNLGSRSCRQDDGQDCEQGSDGKILLGFAMYAGGVMYSLIDAGLTIGRYNAGREEAAGFGWTPTLVAGSGGALKTGATAWIRF
jgi:hypothetical protein